MYNALNTPHVGVAGEQLSLYHSPTPAFPIKIQPITEDLSQEQQPSVALITSTPAVTMENIDHNVHLYRGRQLSTFEEESETESPPESKSQVSILAGPEFGSPVHSGSPRARSRKLLNARSSPNIFGPGSKSDVSDDEEDEEEDGIVELMTTSGRFPNKSGTFPRLSPNHSPLLTSRRSPTHYLTGSSDDEVATVFESARKNRSKRLPFRKRSIKKLARVDSISSDDGAGGGPREVRSKSTSRKERLLRLRHFSSLPATPNENLASDSLTNLLENIRRQRSGSVRSNSSLSDGGRSGCGGDKDMNDLANSIVSRFELSDDDAGGYNAEQAMDTDKGAPLTNGSDHNMSRGSSPGVGSKRTGSITTLRSVFCSIL